jgi:hypothetical protein
VSTTWGSHSEAYRYPTSAQRSLIRTPERIDGLLTGGGSIWSTHVAWVKSNLWALRFAPPTPLEVFAVGIAAWIHAKLKGERGSGG